MPELIIPQTCPDCARSKSGQCRKCYVNQGERNIIPRFWEKIDKNGPIPPYCPEIGPCWLYIGGHDSSGYGLFNVGHQHNIRAHVFSYKLHYGEITPGFFVCHKCDNPPCARPDHLFEGTPEANTHDAMGKGRMKDPPHFFGEEHHNAKLNKEKVLEIRRLFEQGLQKTDIATMFGITRQCVRQIVARETWRAV